MGLMDRLSRVFLTKSNTMIDHTDDPRQAMEHSSERLSETVQQVRRSVADVITSRRRLELQAAKLAEGIGKLEDQAGQALAADRDDIARTALERKKVLEAQLQSLDEERAQLQSEQDRLALAEQRMSAKLEAFESRKESIRAQYTAAEAQVRIGEVLSGISEEMVDVGLAIERAETKTEAMRARAEAIDELIETGAVVDLGTEGRSVGQLGEGRR